MIYPFSNSSYLNLCKIHAKSLSRKDLVKNHLEKMQKIDENEEHPSDDPLWIGFAIQ